MEDGVRSTNEEFQLDIETRIRAAWEGFPGDKIEVGGNLPQRLEKTMEWLRGHLDDDRLRSQELPAL